ncbi:hypothetical protein OAO01_07890 [Oligoflexia bacterium]|nr:hypothetical protein [Oligoflexia bacterium]
MIDVKHLISYLNVGGKLDLCTLDSKLVKKVLDRGSLIVTCLDEVWVWGHRFHEMKLDDLRGATDGHIVVITQRGENGLSVLDPYPTFLPGLHGYYTIDPEKLAQATLMWDGMIIEVLNNYRILIGGEYNGTLCSFDILVLAVK